MIILILMFCLLGVSFYGSYIQPVFDDYYDNHTCEVEKKSRDNYIKTSSGYYEYGSSDLMSNSFLEGLGSYLGQTYDNDLSYANNNEVSNYVITTSGVYKVFFMDFNTRSYTLGFNVSNFVVNKAIWEGDTSPNPVIKYSFLMSNSSPYNLTCELQWFAQRTNDNMLTIWGCQFDASNDLCGMFLETAYYLTPRLMLSEKLGGYNAFIGIIFQNLNSDPYNSGYNVGYNEGYNIGVSSVVDNPDSDWYQSIYNTGYQVGYQYALDTTDNQSAVATSIFNGIFTIGMLPVNVFLGFMDWEVFGINISGFVSGLLSIALLIIVFKFVMGHKV